jgi:heat shock protein HtpX
LTLAEAYLAAWNDLNASLISTLGLGIPALFLLLVLAGLARGVLIAWWRRHSLASWCQRVADLARTQLERAYTVNRDNLTTWPARRRRAIAEGFVGAMPIDQCRMVHGIGPKTVASLREEGFETLGDIDGRAAGVFGVGPVLLGRMFEMRAALVAQAEQELASGKTAVRAPEVEASYERERIDTEQRQTQLVEDLAECDLLATPPELEGSAAFKRDQWLRDLRGTLQDPMPLLRIGLIVLLAGFALGSVPLWLLLAPTISPTVIAKASLSLALGSMAAVLAYHWFLADLAMQASVRPPDPRRFEEQRLQFEAAKMARAAGIVPPQLRIQDDPSFNAFALGVRDGRSSVVIHSGLAQAFPPDEVRAVLGHEITHLQNNDSRIKATQGFLHSAVGVAASVLLWVGQGAMAAGSAFLAAGGRRRSKKGDAATPLIGLTLFLIGVGCLVGYGFARLVGWSAVLMRFATAREAEYRADLGGATLVGSTDRMRDALVRLATSPEPRWMAGRIRLHLLEDPSRMKAGATSAIEGLFATHPPIEARIEALDNGTAAAAVRARSWVTMSALAVGIVVVVGVVGSLEVRSVGDVRIAQAGFAPEATSAAKVTIRVGRCNVRKGPADSRKVIGTVRHGVECQIVDKARGGWLEVTCPGDTALQGFLHRSCL